MINSTPVSQFLLAAYLDSGPLNYLYFLLLLSLYCSVIFSNVLLILVICANRSLHQPMYMFLCSLLVTELYGSTGVFPFLLLQILSDVHTVRAPACFLQIFCIYSYGNIEYFTLVVMSYDRYLAICHPLQYSSRMSVRKVALLLAAAWLPPLLLNVVTIYLLASLRLCRNVVHKVYCDHHSLVKLACSDGGVNNVYGLVFAALSVFAPLLLILFSYGRILQVCFSGSGRSRRKAAATCTPHLASLLNFSCGACFEILQSRFDMSFLPGVLRIFLSLYFLTCQPLFSPVMFGLKLSKIRVLCRNSLAAAL